MVLVVVSFVYFLNRLFNFRPSVSAYFLPFLGGVSGHG